MTNTPTPPRFVLDPIDLHPGATTPDDVADVLTEIANDLRAGPGGPFAAEDKGAEWRIETGQDLTPWPGSSADDWARAGDAMVGFSAEHGGGLYLRALSTVQGILNDNGNPGDCYPEQFAAWAVAHNLPADQVQTWGAFVPVDAPNPAHEYRAIEAVNAKCRALRAQLHALGFETVLETYKVTTDRARFSVKHYRDTVARIDLSPSAGTLTLTRTTDGDGWNVLSDLLNLTPNTETENYA
jgi:hypothetical protein